MAIYWRLKDVPELEGLNRADRYTVIFHVINSAGKKGVIHWLLLSWAFYVICYVCLVFMCEAVNSWVITELGLIHEINMEMSVWEMMWAAMPAGLIPVVVSVEMMLLICLALRPIRISMARPMMREFLAGG